MAFEKAWTNVPPIPLTADGSPLGVITIADTINFKVKGLAQLANNTGLTMVVQVNQVLSPTTMVVGRPGSSPSATAGGLATGAVVDVSAFTTATASTIGFAQQPKNKIKPDDIEQAIYETDPVVARRAIQVDPYGEFYTPANTFPVNIIPETQIPFTLGSLAMPALVNNLVNGLTYDEVVSTNVDGEEILTFYSGGIAVIEVTLTKIIDGWILNLGAPLEDFLLLEDGNIFGLENGTGEILLET